MQCLQLAKCKQSAWMYLDFHVSVKALYLNCVLNFVFATSKTRKCRFNRDVTELCKGISTWKKSETSSHWDRRFFTRMIFGAKQSSISKTELHRRCFETFAKFIIYQLVSRNDPEWLLSWRHYTFTQSNVLSSVVIAFNC